jgi:8-hydroxy-5-deazaflavin:NADPH oxidoreductase
MKIGIIGANGVGATLTRRLRQLGHDVAIAGSRGSEMVSDLVKQTGAKAVSVRDAARGRDLVVITVPEVRVKDLPSDLFQGANDDLVVIDACNYYPREGDGRIDAIEEGLTESQWVERQIGWPVVKAFNNIYWKDLMENGKPKGARGRIAVPVAGDQAGHKAVVFKLVEDLGFDAVDSGSLSESWRQQPDTPVYASDLDAKGTRQALAQASREREPHFPAVGSFEG